MNYATRTPEQIRISKNLKKKRKAIAKRKRVQDEKAKRKAKRDAALVESNTVNNASPNKNETNCKSDSVDNIADVIPKDAEAEAVVSPMQGVTKSNSETSTKAVKEDDDRKETKQKENRTELKENDNASGEETNVVRSEELKDDEANVKKEKKKGKRKKKSA